MSAPSSHTLTFPWRTAQGERAGILVPIFNDQDNLVDISAGWLIDAKIKDMPGGTTLHVFPPEDIDTSSRFSVGLLVPAEITSAWTWRVGWWRLLLTDPLSDPNDPAVTRVVQGPFVIDPD